MIFFILEGVLIEFRERMKTNMYWNQNREKRNKVIFCIVGLKEFLETSWQIYGAIIYFSKDAENCSKENEWDMTMMSIFLFIGAIKICLLMLVLIILTYIGVRHLCKRNKEKSASKNILRSLSKIKYSALSISANAGN